MPTTETIVLFTVVALLSYLLGSINFAIIVSHVYAKDDVRRYGSGSAGMTNILRTYGKGPAAVTAAGDFLKAAMAIVISRILFEKFGIPLDAAYPAGLFAVIGHIFPLYFKFKGGKAVMATLGVIFCSNPLVFAIILVLSLPIVLISRFVSLGSVFGAIAYPLITWIVLTLRGQEALSDTIWASILAVVVLFMHRDNIKRLLNGTENRFGNKKKDGAAKD